MVRTLVEALNRAATLYPGNVAIEDQQSVLTYAELLQQARRIARAFAERGVAPGDRVAMLGAKSVSLVAGCYGVMLAGAAYVPLDPNASAEQQRSICAHARPSAVIGDTRPLAAIAAEVPDGCRLISLEHALAGADVDCRALDARAPTEANSAYVLYTSGTTGAPKGVEHTHSSAIAFASWAARHFEIGEDDRLSCHAPLHFDLTTFDLYAAVIAGAATVLIPATISIFPYSVTEYVRSRRITVWYSVPSALVDLVARGTFSEATVPSLKRILFAGESYPPAALADLVAAFPQARLFNLFGPTETNVCVFHALATNAGEAGEIECPIGSPCAYAAIRLVDEDGLDVEGGGIGELWVNSLSNMKGYLNDPAATERVTAVDHQGRRWLKTGDLVSKGGDGRLRFHGRRDRQIKIRGFRIELEAIETALASYEGVTAAAVWTTTAPAGGIQIVAAVEAPQGISEGDLLKHAGRRLISQALPRLITVHSRLPRNNNGKMDRSRIRVEHDVRKDADHIPAGR